MTRSFVMNAAGISAPNSPGRLSTPCQRQSQVKTRITHPNLLGHHPVTNIQKATRQTLKAFAHLNEHGHGVPGWQPNAMAPQWHPRACHTSPPSLTLHPSTLPLLRRGGGKQIIYHVFGLPDPWLPCRRRSRIPMSRLSSAKHRHMDGHSTTQFLPPSRRIWC